MGTINDVYNKWDKENEEWTDITEDPRSLKSCLRKFGFGYLLQDLDHNLEDVRRHKISVNAHKEMIKAFDKKLLKLSLSHHPDHFSGVTEAHNNQATINAIRTLITRLSEDFLRDIDIDYRYEYYAYINLNSIGNEEDVDKLNLNLQYQLIMLSEIKHEKIIANIKKFLMSCEESLDNYYKGDLRNFVLNFNLALNRLQDCILGYKALTREFSNVEKECGKDPNLQNTLWIVKKNSADFERQLKILEKIKDVAKQSLKGNFQFYAENELIDCYFVLPFAKYVNVLSMCNVMLGNTERSWLSQKRYKNSLDFCQLDKDDHERKYHKAYILATYFNNPNSSNENAVYKVFNNKLHGDKLTFCKYNYDSILQNIREKLKEDFNTEKHYIVKSVKKQTEEYNREVQDFFEGMMRRKKYNMLVLMDDQAKSRIDGHPMILSQRFKHEKNIVDIYSRKAAYNEEINEGIEGEEYLLKKMRDHFKEKCENMKTTILQNEIANEKLKEALEVYEKKERVMLEKLGRLSLKINEKLLDEILETEGENRKLRDEIEKKREEEKSLMLTLCSRYEKISILFQDANLPRSCSKMQETKIPGEKLINENRSFEISTEKTDLQEEENDCKEERNKEKLLRVEGNQTSEFEIDRNSKGAKNSFQSLEYQTYTQELKNKSINYILNVNSHNTPSTLRTEEHNAKTIENKNKIDKEITKDRHLFEICNQLTIQAPGKDSDLKNLENDRNIVKSVQASLKENKGFETSGNGMGKNIHSHVQESTGYIKYSSKIDEFVNQSTKIKIVRDEIETKNDEEDHVEALIKHEKIEKTNDIHEFRNKCGYSKTSEEEIKNQIYTNNFEGNDRIKKVSSEKLIKNKSLNNFEKKDNEVKLYAKDMERTLIKNEYSKDKAPEFDMETIKSCETEEKKDREVLEALRNCKQSYKLTYQDDFKKCK